ncbi:hypothetical protein AB6D60_02995 [Vibrio splendidus]
MRPSFGVKVSAPPIPVDKLKNEILWAAQKGYGDKNNGDLSKFPEMQAIQARNSSKDINHLNTFSFEISRAKKRIFIIDAYFFNPDKDKEPKQARLDKIRDWFFNDLMDASDIRILTSCNDKDSITNDDINTQFYELAEMINLDRTESNKCQINIQFTLLTHFNYIHDRFAVIDDELWHFGATVGGFHSQVSAVTRGWDAEKHGAIEFFELAWQGDTIMGKKNNDN